MDQNVFKCFFLIRMGTLLRTKNRLQVSSTVYERKTQPPPVPSYPFFYSFSWNKIIPKSSLRHRLLKGTSQGSEVGCYKVPGQRNLVMVTAFLMLHVESTGLEHVSTVKPIKLYLTNGCSQPSPLGWELLKGKDYVLPTSGSQQLLGTW